MLAGWASNSKYPFFGGVRSTSQMISYEISLGLSLVPILLVMGELNLVKITEAQSQHGWNLLPLALGEAFDWKRWVLLVPLGIAFVTFVISMFAETNRLPFDLPECETELVGGYHTEYSSMKFALFFMGEYAAMIVGSGITVTLFLGGWSLPFGLDNKLPDGTWWVGLLHTRRVLRQADRLPHLFHLGAVDAAAVPVRPVDAPRLGLVVRDLSGQRPADRRPAVGLPLIFRPPWPPNFSSARN